jgi:hypothetical protein
MPNKSERSFLLYQLDFLLRTLAIEGKEKSNEFVEIMELRSYLSTCRYLNPREAIPKSDAMKTMLFRYPDKQFLQLVRMSKSSFVKIAQLIQHHPVFSNNGRYKQEPVWIQLMVTLSRLGCHGNGASIGRNAMMFGTSHGSVVDFTRRVFTALISFKDHFIRWPNIAEREEISNRFARNHGMPGVVGVVDGTPVVFSQRPHIDGEVYWTRKCEYSMNVQLICDDRRRILYYILGWPGSVFDATVFAQSDVSLNPDKYFSPGEFIIADSGYAASGYLCVPYRQPHASIPHNKVFNELFSSARVVIEHVNGILKNRFSSLREMRTQIKEKSDFKRINDWILVCLILHNILLSYSDEWDDVDLSDDESDDNEEVPEDNTNLTVQTLRMRVQNTLLTWFYMR